VGDTRGGYGEHWRRTEQWAGAQVESRGQRSYRNNFQKFIKDALEAMARRQGQQLKPEKLAGSRGGDVVSGRFGKVRHACPGLEEAVRAKASWGPSEAGEPMRGSRSQSQAKKCYC
jgi:hypothetical protein